MKKFLRGIQTVGQRILAEKKSFTVRYPFRYQIRLYSLSYEAAEKIKGQLDFKDALLHTPENAAADPSLNYKGLVLLAAGPGCKHPLLKRLAEPYLEFGLPVVCMINDIASLIFCTPAQRRMSRVLNVVSANLNGPCPIVLKLYCGGITALLPAAAKDLSKPYCKLELAGTIFDSGPPTMKPRNILNASKFLSSQNLYPTWFHKMKELIKALTLSVLSGYRKKAVYDRLMYSPFLNRTPQLYVYSTADYILDIEYINKLIDYQRQHNADVTKHTFNDTLHMLHRLKRAKEYDEMLLNFLAKKCNLPL